MITVITDTTTKGFVCNGYVLNVGRVALLLERALDGIIWELNFSVLQLTLKKTTQMFLVSVLHGQGLIRRVPLN